MIDLDFIRSFFPLMIAKDSRFDRYMLKEYLQLLILDYLSTTSYIGKLSFIGGTNLRLIQGIDRFSEDIDFDCKDLSSEEFIAMTFCAKKSNISQSVKERVGCFLRLSIIPSDVSCSL